MILNFFKYKKNEQEEQLILIIDGMLKHKSSIVKIAPITGKYYITNDDLHYYIMISQDYIQITNSKFTVTKNINSRVIDEIIKNIQNYIEEDRTKLQEKIFKNESTILQHLIDTLNIK